MAHKKHKNAEPKKRQKKFNFFKKIDKKNGSQKNEKKTPTKKQTKNKVG